MRHYSQNKSFINNSFESCRPAVFSVLLCLLAVSCLSVAYGQPEKSLAIESIDLQGNSKTRTMVIRNYLDLKEGQSVSREQLQRAEFRLRKTGFFKEVDLLVQPGTEKGTARLLVQVKERRWPYLQFKSGYNELDGWYLTPLAIRLDNLFGRGNIFGFEYTLGDRVARSKLEYVRPYLFGSEYDFRVEIDGRERQFLHHLSTDSGDEPFRQSVRDGGLLLGINGNSGIPKFFSVALSFTAARVDSYLTRPQEDRVVAPQMLLPDTTVQPIGRFILGFKLDTRDSKRYPLRGWWGGFTLEQARTEVNGELFDFSRIMLDVRRYNRIWKEMVAAARIKWAHADEATPFFEKFYLGGPNSLRGYADRSLTPLAYAENMLLATGELRFPLSGRISDRSRFTGVLFYDAGYAWNAPEEFAFESLKAGLGGGIRLDLPIIGVLRLDFAYPVPEYELRVHLSLGHTF